ncbi:calcium channel flower -like protein [Brachionus plicatilis]|uniref:Calcium channel flower-like protein n=1 Tax=Brachionus plicatilis TaxID=10195 RepID=A0A3M7SVW2_BRAPC|nr:calcium channel flower -like protein [Brachionus plicatilis]
MDSFIGTQQITVTVTPQPQDNNVILKWVLKIATVILGINALWLGFLSIFDLGSCIFGGLIIGFGGILVLILEIPILFGLFDLMKPLANLSGRLEPWHKLIIYLIPAIAGIALCRNITSIFGKRTN